MAGISERLIQITKKHLKVVVGDGIVNEFALRTLYAEVGSIMSNRPIILVSDDPTDLEALTLNQSLLQRKVVGLPPRISFQEDRFRRKQWKKIQYLTDLFWKKIGQPIASWLARTA